MIDLSIVVVTWNTRELVLECLDSIERADDDGLSSETWLVDNGSCDGTVEAVFERFPWAGVVALPDNVGFAAGCNAGIRRANGRHVLLLNSDTRICADALGRCVAYLDAHPDVGIVGPQLLHPDGTTQNSIHNFPLMATELLPRGLFQFLFRSRFPSRRWTGNDPIEVEAIVGAAIFARREVIERVGALPEDYFLFLEETDWCWRVREAGWRIVHLPTAYVTHWSGASSKKKNATLTRIEYHRSLYHFYRKHRGLLSMAIVLGLRLAKSFFYVISQAPLALLGGRHRTRWAMHRDVLLWHLRGCPAAVGLGQLSARAGAGRRMMGGL